MILALSKCWTKTTNKTLKMQIADFYCDIFSRLFWINCQIMVTPKDNKNLLNFILDIHSVLGGSFWSTLGNLSKTI